MQHKINPALLMALALSCTLFLGGCLTATKVTNYDKDGKITSVVDKRGTEYSDHTNARVEFKKSDTDRIKAQSEALKGLVNPTPTPQVPSGVSEPQPYMEEAFYPVADTGMSKTEDALLRVIIAREIRDLQPQEYGEAAPMTMTEGTTHFFKHLKEGVLGAMAIDGLFDFSKKAVEEAGPEVGGDLSGGSIDKSVKEAPVVVVPGATE